MYFLKNQLINLYFKIIMGFFESVFGKHFFQEKKDKQKSVIIIKELEKFCIFILIKLKNS